MRVIYIKYILKKIFSYYLKLVVFKRLARVGNGQVRGG